MNKKKKTETDARQTATYKRIVKDIGTHIASHSYVAIDAQRWYIGITNNPEKRLQEHYKKYRDLMHWRCYYARNLRIAHAIEVDFAKANTINTVNIGGACSDSVYVYVFKAIPTLLDKF